MQLELQGNPPDKYGDTQPLMLSIHWKNVKHKHCGFSKMAQPDETIWKALTKNTCCTQAKIYGIVTTKAAHVTSSVFIAYFEHIREPNHMKALLLLVDDSSWSKSERAAHCGFCSLSLHTPRPCRQALSGGEPGNDATIAAGFVSPCLDETQAFSCTFPYSKEMHFYDCR